MAMLLYMSIGIGDNIHTLDDLSAIPKPITVPACSVAPAASTEELYPGEYS